MKRRFRVGQRVRLLKTYLGESGLTGTVATCLPQCNVGWDPYFAYTIRIGHDRLATYREDELMEVSAVDRLGDLLRD